MHGKGLSPHVQISAGTAGRRGQEQVMSSEGEGEGMCMVEVEGGVEVKGGVEVVEEGVVL